MAKYTPEETKELMKRVLQAYVKLGVIGLACDEVGVRRQLHTQWLERYPAYQEMFHELKEKFVDGLESVAIQRAREKSDSLLITLLKAHRREVYGDRSDVHLSGQSTNAPIQLVFSENMLCEEEKKLLTNQTKGDEEDVPV